MRCEQTCWSRASRFRMRTNHNNRTVDIKLTTHSDNQTVHTLSDSTAPVRYTTSANTAGSYDRRSVEAQKKNWNTTKPVTGTSQQ